VTARFFDDLSANIKSQRLLSLPVVFRLGRGEVAQRRVDALVDVDPI
jgi:hypothetical protein